MLRRRPKLVAFAILLFLTSSVFSVLGFLLKCEPAFYTAAECPRDYDTREKASRILTRLQDLKTDIRTKSEWGETLTAEELNCFFAEMMTTGGAFSSLLPKGLHSPRMVLDGDRIKLGFRYREGFWSTVIWIELRTWLVKDEINVLAMEVCDLRAGRLAVGTQSVLDGIADAARASNIDVVWYRHRGNPVGLFRFFPDQPQPVSQVLTVETRDGKIVIAGRTRTDVPIPVSAIAP